MRILFALLFAGFLSHLGLAQNLAADPTIVWLPVNKTIAYALQNNQRGIFFTTSGGSQVQGQGNLMIVPFELPDNNILFSFTAKLDVEGFEHKCIFMAVWNEIVLEPLANADFKSLEQLNDYCGGTPDEQMEARNVPVPPKPLKPVIPGIES